MQENYGNLNVELLQIEELEKKITPDDPQWDPILGL